MFFKLFSLLNHRERRQAAGLLLMMLLGAALESGALGAIPSFITLLSDPDRVLRFGWVRAAFVSVGAHDATSRALWAAGALVVVYLIKNIYIACFTYIQARYVYARYTSLSGRLFRAYMFVPYSFHLQRNTAELLYRVNEETSRVVFDVLLPTLRVVMEMMILVAILLILLRMEPAVSLVMTLLLGLSSWLFLRAIQRRSTELGGVEGLYRTLMFRSVNQGLGALKEIKVLQREGSFLDQFAAHSKLFAQAGQYRSVVMEVPRLFLETVSVVAIPTVASYMIVRGRPLPTVIPVLALLAVAALRLAPSVNRLITALLSLRWGQPAIDSVHKDLAQLEARPGLVPRTSYLRPLESHLRFADVRFAYPGASQETLRGVSFSVAKGSMVGIVGPSGAGKSTTVDILLGVLQPTSGQIIVDGVNISDDVSGWQRQIGYVPQSIYLTDDTIRNNIALGVPDAEISDAAVASAIEMAQLGDFVRALPAGLNTTIGERGVRLSGGQRQRIGIARALYHNPAVLVFDEATSSLDNETELEVVRSIDRLRGARTIVVIAHRHTTVRRCDQILRIHDGSVEELETEEYFASMGVTA